MCCFKVRSAWSPSGHESAPDPLWPPFPSPSPTSSPTGWMEPTMAELREPTTRARLAAAALFSSSSTSRAVVGRRDLKHHTTRVPLPFPLPLPSPTYRLECYVVVDTDSFAFYLEGALAATTSFLSSFRPPAAAMAPPPVVPVVGFKEDPPLQHVERAFSGQQRVDFPCSRCEYT